jgi:hypothetical protein
MATVAIMRIPDDSPNANRSAGMNPSEVIARPRHPVTVSILPAYISRAAFFLTSGKVETIKVHHLAPGRHEVAHKRSFSVGTSIHFRQSAQLGV